MKAENTARVDAYLDQVLAPPTRRLSRFQQGELRRELRTHLWARMHAYQELGHSEDGAVTEALKQFGGAKDFVREWQREWTKTTPQATLREIGTATRTALLLSLPTLLVAFVVSEASHAGGSIWLRGGEVDGLVMLACGLTNYAVLPFMLGAVADRLIPRYVGIGIAAALTAELAFCYSLACLGYEFSFQPTSALATAGMRLGFSIFVCSAAWVPIACMTAALTSWWTRRTKASQLA